MTNINDLGLPQGLPEMLGNNQLNQRNADLSSYRSAINQICPRWKSADGKTYEYNPFFHSYREVDEHREMTAADLGLPAWLYAGYAGLWPCCEGEIIGHDRMCGLCGNHVSDVLYSFWLGADHG